MVELAPFNVNVICVTPAAVADNFSSTAELDSAGEGSALKNMFDGGKVSTPDEIAKDAYAGFKKNKAQVRTGKNVWLAGVPTQLIAQRFLPKLVKL